MKKKILLEKINYADKYVWIIIIRCGIECTVKSNQILPQINDRKNIHGSSSVHNTSQRPHFDLLSTKFPRSPVSPVYFRAISASSHTLPFWFLLAARSALFPVALFDRQRRYFWLVLKRLIVFQTRNNFSALFLRAVALTTHIVLLASSAATSAILGRIIYISNFLS